MYKLAGIDLKTVNGALNELFTVDDQNMYTGRFHCSLIRRDGARSLVNSFTARMYCDDVPRDTVAMLAFPSDKILYSNSYSKKVRRPNFATHHTFFDKRIRSESVQAPNNWCCRQKHGSASST